MTLRQMTAHQRSAVSLYGVTLAPALGLYVCLRTIARAKLGALRSTDPATFLGGRDVSYHATKVEAVPRHHRMIAGFAPTVTGPADMWVEGAP